MKPAFRQARRGPSTAAGLGQHQLNQRRFRVAGAAVTRAVEQSKPAIAMTQRPQRRGHAFDGGGQHRGGWSARSLQQGADFNEIL